MAYLGRQPNTGVRSRFIFTATASQTTFSGSDDDGKTLKYEDAAYLDVFLNGVLLKPVTDYAATTKTSVVLTSAAAASDIVEIVGYDIANIADTVSAANGGTFDAGVTVNGTVTADGLTVDGNLSVDGGTIKLDGNYPVGTENVALGDAALDDASLTGAFNTAVGTSALTSNAGGNFNSALGRDSLKANTSGNSNVGAGVSVLLVNTTGSNNTAVGVNALVSNTTASDSVAIGYQAGYANTTNGGVTYVGRLAGYQATGSFNSFYGYGSGSAITTGSKNTILGRYDGNYGGLDIRTSSNNIVLSDGDGNPRLYVQSTGRTTVFSSETYVFGINGGTYTWFTGTNGNNYNFYDASGTIRGYLTLSGTFTNTSDIAFKKDVSDIKYGLADVLKIRAVSYKTKDYDIPQIGFIAQEMETVVPEVVSGEEGSKGIAYGNINAVLVKAIQELSAKNDALEARITALENA